MTQNRDDQTTPSDDSSSDDGLPPYFKKIPYWMIGVVLVLTLGLSFVFVYQNIAFRIGLMPEGNVSAHGVARIESCDRSVLAGLNLACDAEVHWESARGVSFDLKGETFQTTVHSTESLSGEVEVKRLCSHNHCDVVPADHPDGDGKGWLVPVWLIATIIFGLIAGLLVAMGIGRIRYRRALAAGTE